MKLTYAIKYEVKSLQSERIKKNKQTNKEKKLWDNKRSPDYLSTLLALQ